MKLYHQCLTFAVIHDGYETMDLPHSIQGDLDVLNYFKNKLQEWCVMKELHIRSLEKLDYESYYRSCNCSILIDCECIVYNAYEIIPGYEDEITRHTHEEEDLKKKLAQLKRELKQVKDEIPSRLKNVAQKIVYKMDNQWLSHLNIV